MAFLQIQSNNSRFSHLIRKNPASGMVCRSLKKGRLFGYYSKNDNSVFNCYFKDSDGENSYKTHYKEDFEFVNAPAYNSPQFVLDAISMFFSHVIKKDSEDDVKGNHRVLLNLVGVKGKYIEIFKKYFIEFDIEHIEVSPLNYRIIISVKDKTLKELLAFVQLFAVFNVLKQRWLEEDEINKYVDYLTKVKAPYFILYVFKVNALNNRNKFNKFKKKLEENAVEDVNFEFGYTTIQRQNKVEEKLKFDRSIADFGCGEGRYIKRFSKKLEDKGTYYAIDIDEEVLEQAEKKAKGLDNVTCSSSFPDIEDELDVVMAEVIEHMEKPDAEKTVKQILNRTNVKSLVITTPNKDFNEFYFLDDEMRHDDHHFEMTKEEFAKWVEEVSGDYEFELFDIGDVVNGIPCTLGAKLVEVKTNPFEGMVDPPLNEAEQSLVDRLYEHQDSRPRGNESEKV